jgi:hypothetical protein
MMDEYYFLRYLRDEKYFFSSLMWVLVSLFATMHPSGFQLLLFEYIEMFEWFQEFIVASNGAVYIYGGN